MASKIMVLALGIAAAAAPLSAQMTAAPTGTADTKYCMKVEANTGSRVERIRCWTRDEWAAQGVDVDQDWAREGIRTIG